MKISIITVCLNSEKTIPFTLNSIYQQTYKNYEHIIVDGGSKDKTQKIIKEYPLKKKKIIVAKDTKIYEALNIGIKNATGKIICILHSNDIYHSPNTLETINKYFEKNSKLEILMTNIVFFKKDKFSSVGRYYSIKFFKSYMMRFGLMPGHTATFIKKKVYDEIGVYNPKFKIAGDFDFFLRCFVKFKKKFKILNITTVRMSTGGISGKNIFSYLISTYEIYKSLKNNKIYSNFFLLLLRFPIKLKQFLIINKKLINLDYEYKIHSFYKKYHNIKFRIIKNLTKIDYSKNFILSAMNLAFLGSYSNNEIKLNPFMINWPDGIFAKSLGEGITKIPGRELLNKLNLKKKNIDKIIVLGFLSQKSKLFLQKKYNLPIYNISLPFGDINKILKSLKIKEDNKSIIFITLPTPKQEQLAEFISKKFKKFRIICIGGSISILSGHEKPVPKILSNFEFIWRLRYETFRRLSRLLKTFFNYFNGKFITKKLNNLNIEIIE